MTEIENTGLIPEQYPQDIELDPSKINFNKFEIYTKYPPEEIQVLKFQDLIEERIVTPLEVEDGDMITMKIPVNQTIPIDNIRPLDHAHAIELGINILKTFQINECIAHPDEDGRIQVIAGDHRRRGVAYVSSWQGYIKIKLFTRTLSESEILRIQIDENKVNAMTPHQKSEVYQKIWVKWHDTHPDGTKTELAHALGVSPQTISRAIEIHDNLDEKVKDLLKDGKINFTQALLIAKLKNRDRQYQEAIHTITNKLTTQILSKRIYEILKNQPDIFFQWSIEDNMEQDPKVAQKISELRQEQRDFKLTWDREASIAIEYIKSISDLLNNNEHSDKIPMTRGVINTLVDLMVSTINFLEYLEENEPDVYKLLFLLS